MVCLTKRILFLLIFISTQSYAALPQTPGTPQWESYLTAEELPESLVLVPPPPTKGSLGFAVDYAVNQQALTLQNSVAWTQAILDADLKFPAASGTFSCALDLPISEENSPNLVKLLHKMIPDAGRATAVPKHHYKRQRPFLDNMRPICTPGELDYFLKDGSYPSGHSSIGMAWALTLTQLAPDRMNALIARGNSLGLSRVVCNLHWLSDIREGRYLGAYVFARLQSNPSFIADMTAAKLEVQAMREKGLKPTRDCAAEALALSMQQTMLKEALDGSVNSEGFQ